MKEERVNLRNSLCQFFRREILFEAMDDIDNIVRRIINSELTCYISDVDIISRPTQKSPFVMFLRILYGLKVKLCA